MTRVVHFVCDVCSEPETIEADMRALTVAIKSSVKSSDATNVHLEHVCQKCMTKIRDALGITATGSRLNPKPMSNRHRATDRVALIAEARG